eukprot:TRINITY_DN3903_c1_g1_i2.p1 TRINITY_DN3903_c1_g1~~TRINITY_DN3903_c1_g1_i2.p1  ORF type:complete len:265 (-),score=60.06 TRINITY_DN3903_c1_g1_i2:215-940(-)
MEEESAIEENDTLKNAFGILVFEYGEEPSDTDIMKGVTRNKHGIIKKGDGFLSNIFPKKKRRYSNRPRMVSMKNPRPFKKVKGESESDSTHQMVQKKEPPKNTDQYMYELEFGNPDAVKDSIPPESAEGDIEEENTEELETVEGTDKDGNKSKKSKKKKKKKKDKKAAKESKVKPKKEKKSKKKTKEKGLKSEDIFEEDVSEDGAQVQEFYRKRKRMSVLIILFLFLRLFDPGKINQISTS